MARGAAIENIGFHRAYRFYSWDEETKVTGTVLKQPGSRGVWLAMVDDTTIKVLSGGRDTAAREAIREARLPEDQSSPHTITGAL
jgi:hypothetical protein